MQVLSIADIATGGGQAIDVNFSKGLRQKGKIRDMAWPSQGQPDSKAWTVWRRVLIITL